LTFEWRQKVLNARTPPHDKRNIADVSTTPPDVTPPDDQTPPTDNAGEAFGRGSYGNQRNKKSKTQQ
jgi:hypothetical protein